MLWKKFLSTAALFFLIVIPSFDSLANPTINPLVGQLAKQSKSLRLVQFVETNWTTPAPTKTTPTFSVNTGDVLVVLGGQANDVCAPFMSMTGTGGLTWTERGTTPGGSGTQAAVFAWSATASSNASISLTFTFANSVGCSQGYGAIVYVFRNSSGVAASAQVDLGLANPTHSVSTTTAGSTVVTLIGEWNAVDGSSRGWLLNAKETSYAWDPGNVTIYGSYVPNVTNTGAHTFGMTGPNGQVYSIISLEVKP